MRIIDWSSDVCSSDLLFYDKRVLDPLAAREDKLANFHANTQVPKLIGLARIHELTGEPAKATAASFFWDRVVHHHSYVIGGNADREYFFEPDTTARHITEATCEHCNTYNMLKLTRHLWTWEPERSGRHTSELQSLMRNSYAVLCLKKQN